MESHGESVECKQSHFLNPIIGHFQMDARTHVPLAREEGLITCSLDLTKKKKKKRVGIESIIWLLGRGGFFMSWL